MTIADGDALVERLGRLETSQVSDILDEAGLPNQVLAALPVRLGRRGAVAGRAACTAGEPVVVTRHAPPPLPADALERVAGPGTILLIATGGFTVGGCLGGFIAASLGRQGCRAIVTDGAVRDSEEIDGIGLPVHAAAATPINSARRWRLARTGAPVLMPGRAGMPVTIAPGDLILADADGVLAIPSYAAETIVAQAETLAAIERRIRRAMAEGQSRAEAFAANPRFDHVRRVQL